MGIAASFPKGRLVLGILVSPRFKGSLERGGELLRGLEARLGRADRLGPELDFTWSGYYDAEMGGRPRRSFMAFEELVDPPELADIKLWTNELERLSMVSGGRGLNLDPGLLSLTRFVLATTKDRPHRIPLAKGIYADLTLIYESSGFRALPWTYPDWASVEYRAFLLELREELRARLAGPPCPGRDGDKASDGAPRVQASSPVPRDRGA